MFQSKTEKDYLRHDVFSNKNGAKFFDDNRPEDLL